MKVLIQMWLHIGDRLIATAVVRDLKRQYPEYRIGVETPLPMSVFTNNPYIDWSINRNNADKIVKLRYSGDERTGSSGHCIEGALKRLNEELGTKVKLSVLAPDIHLPITRTNKPGYWIINAGHQTGSSVKNLGLARYQEIVDRLPEIKFVQIGGKSARDVCKPLRGVENLIGQTNVQEVFSLLSGASGVISPPSFIVHMNIFKNTPSIVLNGGREPDILTKYPNTIHFSCIGKYECCKKHACKKFQVEKNSGERKACLDVVSVAGEAVPRCMAELNLNGIINKIRELNDLQNLQS